MHVSARNFINPTMFNELMCFDETRERTLVDIINPTTRSRPSDLIGLCKAMETPVMIKDCNQTRGNAGKFICSRVHVATGLECGGEKVGFIENTAMRHRWGG